MTDREGLAKEVKRINRVSYLTAYLEMLLRVGAIPVEYRADIDKGIASTRAAFDLPSLRQMERTDA
jgi:hypothetical protein